MKPKTTKRAPQPPRTFRFMVVVLGEVRGVVTYSRCDGYGAELADGTPLIGAYASRDAAELAVIAARTA